MLNKNSSVDGLIAAEKYEKMGVVPSDAAVLDLLESLLPPVWIQTQQDRVLELKQCDIQKIEVPLLYDGSKSFDDISNCYLALLPHIFFKANKKGEVFLLCISSFEDPPSLSFPLQMSNLKNLQILDLSGVNLKEIPEFVFQLEQLEYLDVNLNDIEEVPEKIAKLESLKFLDISRNRISKVPEGIFTMKSLVGLELDVEDSRDIELPSTLEVIEEWNKDHPDDKIYIDPNAKGMEKRKGSPCRYISKEFSEVKEKLTYSQQLLYYQSKRYDPERKKRFDQVRELLYNNTVCKHEREVVDVYPYSLLCVDCKEMLELWKYGLI